MALYVITGVAGFIGSALARAVLEQGDQVIGVDNLSTGKAENIAEIRERVDFREADINDARAMSSACRGADYVLHQAAIASVPRSVREPELSNHANVDGTLALLMAARGAGVKRVVYAASSSAYGDNPAMPKREDMLPAPVSPYAVAKLAAEHYMRSFWKCYGLETVALRYFNIFGPRQDPASQYSAVFAKFIASMLAGEQPTIFGDGEQSRDFTYIDNCVSANLLACTAPAEKCAGRVFNVGIGERHSVREVFDVVKKHTGFAGEPAFAETRAGDVKHTQADISAIREALGYKPLVGFDEGVKRTVDWYRKTSS
ncbi:MAG: SDR family oxidoreductase [Candidatus Koribacter versatilis]|uniref:SDR family oxidoreductase n=1 Tax=Candidatus Korobacter versatilis TaxID=658062 RepID=A0A932A7H7_9BACT|nr:SDR family oxidoreductase [Candidatus Koribacter versatilis]